jgi:hypothetical protein
MSMEGGRRGPQARQPIISAADPAPEIHRNDPSRGIALNLGRQPGDPVGIDGEERCGEQNQQSRRIIISRGLPAIGG